MTMFLLRSDADPMHEMIIVNPNMLSKPDEAHQYAQDFTDTLHEKGYADDRLIPLADLAIDSATNSDDQFLVGA